MRLSCFELGIDISFKENEVSVLIIENKQILVDVIKKLQEKSEDIILSEKDESISLVKYLEIVLSPFFLELNNKKILAHLFREYDIIAMDFYSEEKDAINSNIVSLLDKIVNKTPYPVIFNLEMDFKALLKLYDVRIDWAEMSLLEKTLYYIQLEKMLCGTDILVLVNFKSYFNTEQLHALYQCAFNNKMHLLLIESCESMRLEEEKYFIIDNDRCIITYD